MYAEAAYVFRHALVRDAAYQLQMPGERAALHELAVAVFEQLFGEPPQELGEGGVAAAHPIDPHSLELCDHLRRCDLAEKQQSQSAAKLATYLGRAARFADSMFQYEVSGRLFKERAALRGPAGAMDYVDAAVAATSMNDLKEARSLCNMALRMARAAGNPNVLGAALCEAARQSLLTGKGRASARLAQIAEKILRGCGSPLLQRAHHMLGLSWHDVGDSAKSRQHYLRANRLARASDNRKTEGLLLNNLGCLHLDGNEFAAAERCFKRAQARAEGCNDYRTLGYIFGNLAELYAKTGRAGDVEMMYRKSAELHRTTGNRVQEGWICSELGRLHMKEGDTSSAEAMWRRSLAVLDGTYKPRWRGAVFAMLAVLYFRQARFVEAESCAADAARILREDEPRERAHLDAITRARALSQ